jgi:hypothetical protein
VRVRVMSFEKEERERKKEERKERKKQRNKICEPRRCLQIGLLILSVATSAGRRKGVGEK